MNLMNFEDHGHKKCVYIDLADAHICEEVFLVEFY